MRLETLLLRGPGEERRLHFHERLTVVSGLGAKAREYLVEELVGTLCGLSTDSGELSLVDRTGRRTLVRRLADGTVVAQHPDGTPAASPAALLDLDAFGLFALAYVRGSDLGVTARRSSVEPPELREARSALAALTEQVQAAEVARDAARALAVELETIEHQLRDVDFGRERRRYARLCLKLEHVRAEAAALHAPSAQVAADQSLVALRTTVDIAAMRWQDAARRVRLAAERFGARPRLDAETVAGALTLPELPPPDLEDLATAFEVAQAEREALAGKLHARLGGHLPDPSHPDVVRLARRDQESVWRTARWALETGLRVERESIALGGLRPDGVEVPAVRELDEAHAAVEQARETIEERRFGAFAAGGAAALAAVALPVVPLVAPLALAGAASAAYWAVLAPRKELAVAEGWEEDALTRAGVPTYLAFHLRRQAALADPNLRRPLEEAAEEHRRAIAAWRALAGDLSPAEGLDLEDEVRSYAVQLEQLHGADDEIAELRRRLADQAEPAVERAREALLAVCRPYGIEDTTLAADLVHQLAGVATIARLQEALEAAEAAEAPLRAELEQHLASAGLTDGAVDDRVARFEELASAAEQRVRARAHGRSPEAIAAEVQQLEELVQATYRVEFGTIRLPVDAQEPNVEDLESRRALTRAAYTTASRLVPDVTRLADRRSALERRVATLVAELGEARPPSIDTERVEAYLRERLARAACVGPNGERVPLLLDEPFATVRTDLKWELLDMVDRVAGDGQIVFLTADAEVQQWARLRAAGGGLTLQEPGLAALGG